MDPRLTPRQTFEHYYKLRCDKIETYKERMKMLKLRVDELVKILGLESV